ncbi:MULTISPECIES: SfnB family sulfur acquisition oxidoreductase [Burkholderia]|uniref:SfnB family sulfur acquisition oxidoreductase n=1 Tax=Burkholderia mayonis TaxID=1385591 RepID=A0A1B4FKS9_9BURK|nr:MULTISPECIES: SfnB family sulfur acquisition oxidoreductase [Burkholderia]AOJ04286.1 SfnB family sulfur acquisition oxidoreductase [Burkholderia mayonis]KVE43776.1 SfnB family sulfur acquisition oxidoreductase [Burkholderia mayonis]KVE43876.1 SfnB family sulfur acquisition oxidoreductase [Burkholderia sp. BDU5]
MNAVTQSSAARAARRISNDAEAIDAARTFAATVAPDAAARDRERRLPYAELDAYSATGLWGIAAPRAFGGAAVSAATLAEVTAIVSEADPAIGQIPQNHFFMLEVLRVNGTRDQQRFYFERALAGERFGNALSERGTKHVRDYRTTITPDGAGFRLNGRKFYSTGARFAHWIPVVAKDANERLHVAFTPAHAPGLTVEDDWNGFGQRTTGSGTTRLDNVYVDASAVVPYSDAFDAKPTPVGPFGQLLHAAVDLGIARAAFADARRFVRERARPWIDSGVERASDDPLTLEIFGKLAVDLDAAGALTERAGLRVDAAIDDANERTVAAASIAVAKARAATTEIALAASSRLLELAGTQGALAEHALDRHWRNARTHTLHDPVRWKYVAIADYYLNDALPPRHGAL